MSEIQTIVNRIFVRNREKHLQTTRMHIQIHPHTHKNSMIFVKST